MIFPYSGFRLIPVFGDDGIPGFSVSDPREVVSRAPYELSRIYRGVLGGAMSSEVGNDTPPDLKHHRDTCLF